jgi:hypothetical protein
VNFYNFILLYLPFEYKVGFLIPEAGLSHSWKFPILFFLDPQCGRPGICLKQPHSGDYFPMAQLDSIYLPVHWPHIPCGLWPPHSYSVTPENSCLLVLNSPIITSLGKSAWVMPWYRLWPIGLSSFSLFLSHPSHLLVEHTCPWWLPTCPERCAALLSLGPKSMTLVYVFPWVVSSMIQLTDTPKSNVIPGQGSSGEWLSW